VTTSAERSPGAQRDWVAGFLVHLRHERGLSPRTCEAYSRDLKALLEYCDAEGQADLESLGSGQVRGFAAWRHRRGASGRSIQRALSAIRSFYDYLLREGWVRRNPALGVSAPKSRRALPGVLDVDRVSALLEFSPDDVLGVRDRAIMELMYSSGLRLSEVVALDLGDVDLREGLVAVTGKGRKRRIVPVGRHARTALQAWRQARGGLAASGETSLFVGKRGRRMSGRGIQHRIGKWALARGLGQHVHPHMLRHSFASHMLESSGDLRAVQELLGHADIRTTQVYTHLDFQHLAKVYDQAHPRARRPRGRRGDGD